MDVLASGMRALSLIHSKRTRTKSCRSIRLSRVFVGEKRGQRPQLIGHIQISLSTFRRGEMVDGWFPVINRDVGAAGLQVGEIRIKIRMDE